MLGRSVNEHWTGGPPAGVWGPMHDHLQTLDGLFVNLECCISDRGERTPDRGYYFRADPDWALPALDAGGVVWASLANNHVLDYGPVALEDTTAHLASAGIATAGAGPTLQAALRPSTVTVAGLDVAVLAFEGRAPAYAASSDGPGTAHVDFDRGNRRTRRLVRDALAAARTRDPDLVVASLHWGPNWETEPAHSQIQFGRWLVDHGVDVVHGHSAHVVQGIERYRGRPIIYDAGDFVDDYVIKDDLHNDRSFLFELHVVDDQLHSLRLVPVEIEDETVTRADESAATWLRDRMQSLCDAFGTRVVRAGDGLRIPLTEC